MRRFERAFYSTCMRLVLFPDSLIAWQWLTVLSLDAPLVALVWQQMFARILKAELLWYQPLVLGLGFGLCMQPIDGLKAGGFRSETVQTQRHFSPIRWRWRLFAIGLVAIAVELGGVESDARLGMDWGLVLVLPTLVYPVSHQLCIATHPGRIPKEFRVAVLFPLGPALAPIVQSLQQSADGLQIGRELFSELFVGFWFGVRDVRAALFFELSVNFGVGSRGRHAAPGRHR